MESKNLVKKSAHHVDINNATDLSAPAPRSAGRGALTQETQRIYRFSYAGCFANGDGVDARSFMTS
jgi:hypothetical protein